MNHSPKNAFSFPLTIDPLRIVLAVGRSLPLVIFLCLLGLTAGYFLDKKLVPEKNRHSIKNALLKAETRVGLGSDAFEPRALDLPVLEKLLFAPAVIQLTNQRLGSKYDKDQFMRHFEVQMDYQSDIFTLVTHSYNDGEETLRMNRAWSAAAIEYGKQLQTEEVQRFTSGLSDDIEAVKAQLFLVNSNLLAVSSQNALNQQGSTGDSGMSYEELNKSIVARQLDLNALNAQIQNYIRDIVSQSPRAERLKELRIEYTKLLNSYTVDNPLVIAKQQEISKQEALIDQSMNLAPETLTDEELRRFATTPLSEKLYINVLELRSQRYKIEEELKRFQSNAATRRDSLNKQPETKLRLSSLEQQQTDLLQKLAKLENAYESGLYYKKALPGYYTSIQEPTIEDVYYQSYLKKYGKSAAIYLFCFAMFAGLALLLAVRKEFKRPGCSTPLQAAIRMRRLPSISIISGGKGMGNRDQHEYRECWLTLLSKQPVGERKTLVAALGSLDATEQTFWQEMLECAAQDQCPVLVLDAADHPLDWASSQTLSSQENLDQLINPLQHAVDQTNNQKSLIRSASSNASGNAPSFYLSMADIPLPQLSQLLDRIPQEMYTLIRWNTAPHAGLADLSHHLDQTITLLSPTHSAAAEAQSRDRILSNMMGPSKGFVLLDHKPKGLIHRFIVWYENAYFDWKKSQTAETS